MVQSPYQSALGQDPEPQNCPGYVTVCDKALYVFNKALYESMWYLLNVASSEKHFQ